MSKTMPDYVRVVGDFEDIEELIIAVGRLTAEGTKAVLVAYSNPKEEIISGG